MTGKVISREVADAVTIRGLVADVWGHGAVRVTNPAGEPEDGNPQGQLMHPGLRQEIVCRERDGVLWWWVWSGPPRQSPPELEPLCPITEVETAADRLSRVLAVPFVGSPDGGA